MKLSVNEGGMTRLWLGNVCSTVQIFVSHRKMLIVPSVTMNGCSRTSVISSPLINPHRRPTPGATRKATPIALNGPLSGFIRCMTSAPIMALSAKMEPTEMSIPPVMMTNVSPTDMIAYTAKKVSERAAAALKCLPSTGVKVVIASARPPRSVRQIYQELALDTWQINYNGALIWDEPSQQPIFHRPMHPRLVRMMIERCRDMFEEVLVSCEVLDKWFTDRDEHTYTTETGKLFKPDVICPVDQICAQPITKLMLLGDPRIISRLESL